MNKNFDFDNIRKAIDLSYIPFDHEIIDKMIDAGNRIDEIYLNHAIYELKNLKKVKTKHGILDVEFNAFLPPMTLYVVKKPSN
jgi:hypothetical protein